jgi:hypothetical protein
MKLKCGVLEMKAGFIEATCLHTSRIIENILGELRWWEICVGCRPRSWVLEGQNSAGDEMLFERAAGRLWSVRFEDMHYCKNRSKGKEGIELRKDIMESSEYNGGCGLGMYVWMGEVRCVGVGYDRRPAGRNLRRRWDEIGNAAEEIIVAEAAIYSSARRDPDWIVGFREDGQKKRRKIGMDVFPLVS